MSEQNDTNATTPQPNPDLRTLDGLVGAWQLTGEAVGHISYEWMEGGFFLLQRYDFDHGGHRVTGIEVIGHAQEFGEEPSEDIVSRIYDNAGNTFSYAYEVTDETLTIWAGGKGSPAYYRGQFSENGNVNSGRWVYPDGGGYASTMTRKVNP